ncbi:transcription factor-like 5 protein [Cololabis saira]|uniref:transcription factor-like 5 protein n=1 Tax=Cololabis saira TaxID=129043 RepID=UPI002AD4932A|nr:transcription factor-like 5 protein [Cololabis saira]
MHPFHLEDHTSDSAGLISHRVGCAAQELGQMLLSELGLMEMTDVDYSHFQHFIQAHVDTQTGAESRPHSAAVMVEDTTVISPFISTQAIDLSTTCDDHYEVMSGEQTPVSYGEVPSFVLAKVNSEGGQCEAPAKVLQQSAEVQEAVQPQKEMCAKPDGANSVEISSNYPVVGGVFDPNMCGQVIPDVVEPNKHHALIIPSFAFNFHPESLITKTINSNCINPREEQTLVNTQRYVATPAAYKINCSNLSSQSTKAAKAAPESVGESQRSSCKRARPGMPLSLRRERHNSKERDRRKMMRLCCDELNTMVPFCNSNTDKVTTLQLTTAFLRYINKTCGDTFKEEFQKNFTHDKSMFLVASSSSDKHSIHQKMNETLSIPLGAEQ